MHLFASLNVAAATVTAAAAPGGTTRAAVSAGLPRLGEAGALDLAAERQLGDRIAQQIYRDPDFLDDPVLVDYLATIWQPLLAAAQATGDVPVDLSERFAWQLMPVRDRTVNAFALPGGYFGVHLGLIATVATADELASVLAHELSHVSQRHISRMMAQQDRQMPWLVGAMILGVLAAHAAKNADIGQAAMVGGQAMAAQTQLNFSRDMEREADRVGYGVMTSAGFDGLAFVTMFDKLQQSSRLNDDGAFPYLRSHPLTTERMADMRARVPDQGGPLRSEARPPVSAQWHAMMATRARVLAETDTHRLNAVLTARPGQTAVDAVAMPYGAALAALRLKHSAYALKRVQAFLALPGLDAPARKAAELLALEVAVLGDLDAAAWGTTGTTLQQRALGAPDRASVLWGAQAAIRWGRAPQASARLQTWVAEHPKDAAAWQTLSQAWSAQGQPLRAVRAEAEARWAILDLAGAVDRLRAARESARERRDTDHMELSIVDARFRELSQLLREQQAAEKAKP
ncbi:MAG: M48 family metalloprotease [Burkholderiales bacterium]|nr:M48 family metalloprotease [Burkholderiales bacterium]